MNPRFILPTLLFLFVLILTACQAGAGKGPEVESEMTYDRLMSALKGAGVNVEMLGEISQPFFPVAGKSIRINNADVQVFEFQDSAASREAAASVSPSGGSIGTSMVTWIATPHFYQSDRLIAIYLGDDPAAMQMLESLLGPQFAGG